MRRADGVLRRGREARISASGERNKLFHGILSPVVQTARGILPSGPVTTVFSAFERTARRTAASRSSRCRRGGARSPTPTPPPWPTSRSATVPRGYGPGHRVALKLETRPEFPLHFLALNSLGAAVVPLNPDYRTAELEYVLAHSEASAVITRRTSTTLRRRKPAARAECALLYTSGTTGKPKAAC